MKVLKELQERRDAAAKELRDLDASLKLDSPRKDEDGKEITEREPTAEEEQRMVGLLNDIESLDKDIDREFKREKREKKLGEVREFISSASQPERVDVVKEPMQYGLNSDGEHSFFLDYVRYATGPLMGNPDFGVIERMATWAHQVEREIANDTQTGKDAMVQLRGMHNIRSTANPMEAQRRLAEIRDRGRASLEAKQQEFRERALSDRVGIEARSGITTGGGATASASGGGGAAFVLPVFYEGQYAPYREAGRPFADACNQRPLPPYGMTVYIPAVQSAAAVSQQTPEGGGIAEQDPNAGFLAGGLVTTAGEVTVTQQLLDRAGPNVQYDQIMFDQLRRDYAPKWDTYVLKQALANAGTVTYTGSWAFVAAPNGTNPSFVGKCAQAVNAIETTNGTVMSPTDIFVQTSRWNFIESVGALESASGSLHPLLVPQSNGPFNAFSTQQGGDGSVPYEGNTGYRLFGLPISKDLSIPTPGTGADQAIVGNLDEVWAFEGPLVPRVVPQTLAPNLAVLLQLYSYGTTIVRYPAAVQTVTGSGMATVVFA